MRDLIPPTPPRKMKPYKRREMKPDISRLGISESVLKEIETILPDRIALGPNGEIVLEWQRAGAVIVAEIDHPNTAGAVEWAVKEPNKGAIFWDWPWI